MGFGIVLVSDDVALRSQLRGDAAQAAADLIAVVGEDSYPDRSIGGPTVGAWQRVAVLHSSDAVAMRLSGDGLVVDEPEPLELLEEPQGWVPSFSAAEQHHLALDVAHGRAAAPVAAADRAQETVRSVWWVYADSLPWESGSGGLDGIAAGLGATATSSVLQSFGVGSHGVAANRGGGVVPGGQARIWWSGNRVADRARLTEFETADLLPRLG